MFIEKVRKWLRGNGLWIMMLILALVAFLFNIFAISVWGPINWPMWFTLPVALFFNPSVVFVAMTGSMVDTEQVPGSKAGDFSAGRFFGSMLLFLGFLILVLMITM